jgi:methylmalonyl-CoA mutase cobalamin-binding domain/chain
VSFPNKRIIQGLPKRKIEEVAAQKQARIDNGTDSIIGVNKYKTNDKQEIEVLEVDNDAVRKNQLARLKQLKSERNSQEVEKALHAITLCASTKKGNLLELAIEAARKRATLGEISDAMEKVFGRYEATISTISGVYSKESAHTTMYKEVIELTNQFAQLDGRRPRILIAKMGQDGHDRGAKVIATGFADLGFDVDIAPLFQTPEEVAMQAAENDVHIIGISSLAGGHKTLLPEPNPIIHPKVEEKKMPQYVDVNIYNSALEDRNNAEMHAAQIYSQYLEVVQFNEKLLRNITAFDRFRRRARQVYNQAKRGDQIVADNLKENQRSLITTERLLSDLQIENETLRIALNAHEEAFRQVTNKLGLAEATMEQANLQFVTLSEEFDRRGLQIAEQAHENKAHILQIEQIGQAITEVNLKYDKTREENILLTQKLRETQIQEAGIAALNHELTEVITKIQKQIHTMEAQNRDYRDWAERQIDSLKNENERLKDNIEAKALIDKSRQAQQAPKPTPPTFDRAKLDEFLNRWTKVIDEVSTATSSFKTKPKSEEKQELMSEHGDLL